MSEGKLHKMCKTYARSTIRDLGHALQTHHDAPRMHKPHQCHLKAPGRTLGPHVGIWDPYGGLVGASWEL